MAILTERVTEVPNVPFFRAELAQSLLELGDLLVAVRRPAEAEEPFRQAMEHMQWLVKRFPDNGPYRDRLALCHLYLGNLRTDASRRDEAAEHYRQAFVLIEALIGQWPKDPNYLQCVAWNRATCLDPKFRDLDRAVRVGKQLVEEIAPRDGDSWHALGAAYYRAGDWKAAVAALERARELKKGGDNQGTGSSWPWPTRSWATPTRPAGTTTGQCSPCRTGPFSTASGPRRPLC